MKLCISRAVPSQTLKTLVLTLNNRKLTMTTHKLTLNEPELTIIPTYYAYDKVQRRRGNRFTENPRNQKAL